jgi:hypothetical protein
MVALSADKKLLVFDLLKREAASYDPESGMELWRSLVQEDPRYKGFWGWEVFSPDGRYLVQNGILVDLRTGRPGVALEAPRTERVASPLAISRDGRWIAGYLTGELDAGAPRFRLPPSARRGCDPVRAVALWDADTGKIKLRHDSRAFGGPLTFGPGDRSVVLMTQDGIVRWELPEDRWTVCHPAPGDDPYWGDGALGVSPDGRKIATARRDGTILLWPLPASKQ